MNEDLSKEVQEIQDRIERAQSKHRSRMEQKIEAAKDNPESYRTREYRLPKAFWIDHLDRGCRCSEVCPDQSRHDQEPSYSGIEQSRNFLVKLTDLDAKELLSDAEHYSDATRWMGPHAIGLQSSARATVKAVKKVLS